VAAELEATLDFDEPELDGATLGDPVDKLGRLAERLRALVRTWDEGHLLREGALVVICGRPNVGKSTLLNALLGTDRAIVADVPGTTRDTIEETMVLNGIAVRLVDTAGLRQATDCGVEEAGVARAEEVIARADVVVYVVDGSLPPVAEDEAAIRNLGDRPVVIALNKNDLGANASHADARSEVRVACSGRRGTGLTELREAIVRRLGIETDAPPHAVIGARHFQCIQNVLNEIDESCRLLASGGEESRVLAASVLRGALERLGRITGRTYDEALLDAVFSRFCIGK
jgi:tRNA modification GTPase